MHILASPCIAQPLPRPGQAMPCTRGTKVEEAEGWSGGGQRDKDYRYMHQRGWKFRMQSSSSKELFLRHTKQEAPCSGVSTDWPK